MKKMTLLKHIILAAILGYAPLLLAQDTGLYIGLGVGQAKGTIENMTAENLPLPDIFQSKPIAASSSNSISTDTTWAIYGGYQINRFFGIEGLYTPLGEYTRDFVSKAIKIDTGKPQPKDLSVFGLGTFKSVDRLKLGGLGLTALLQVPLTNRLAIFAKYGIFHWTGNLDHETVFNYPFSANPRTYAYTDKESGYTPILGFGGFYRLKHGVSLRAEWMRISSVGGALSTGKSDVNSFLLGAQISF